MNSEFGKKRSNFLQALATLDDFARQADEANALETAGLIKAFEFTFETCWKYLKAALEAAGLPAPSPRQVFKLAYAQGWLVDEETWLSMIAHRNLSVHTYNRDLAKEIFRAVVERYLPEFRKIDALLASV